MQIEPIALAAPAIIELVMQATGAEPGGEVCLPLWALGASYIPFLAANAYQYKIGQRKDDRMEERLDRLLANGDTHEHR